MGSVPKILRQWTTCMWPGSRKLSTKTSTKWPHPKQTSQKIRKSSVACRSQAESGFYLHSQFCRYTWKVKDIALCFLSEKTWGESRSESKPGKVRYSYKMNQFQDFFPKLRRFMDDFYMELVKVWQIKLNCSVRWRLTLSPSKKYCLLCGICLNSECPVVICCRIQSISISVLWSGSQLTGSELNSKFYPIILTKR